MTPRHFMRNKRPCFLFFLFCSLCSFFFVRAGNELTGSINRPFLFLDRAATFLVTFAVLMELCVPPSKKCPILFWIKGKRHLRSILSRGIGIHILHIP